MCVPWCGDQHASSRCQVGPQAGGVVSCVLGACARPRRAVTARPHTRCPPAPTTLCHPRRPDGGLAHRPSEAMGGEARTAGEDGEGAGHQCVNGDGGGRAGLRCASSAWRAQGVAARGSIGAPGSMRDTTTEAHAQRLGGGERRSPSLSGVHATSSLRRPRESRLRPRSPQLPVSQPPLHPCGMKPTVLTAHLRRHYTRIQALSGKASVRERRFPCMTNVLKAGPGGRSSVG